MSLITFPLLTFILRKKNQQNNQQLKLQNIKILHVTETFLSTCAWYIRER